MNIVKNNFRYYFDKSGYTVSQFSNRVNIPRSTLYDYLNEKKEPNIYNANKIAMVLGVFPEDIWITNFNPKFIF